MNDTNTEFDIRYSIRIEQLNAMFFNRVDTLMAITQIFLGSAIFAGVGFSGMAGALVSLLSVITFTVKPTLKAVQSDNQAKRYIALLTPDLDVKERRDQYFRIQELDNHVLLSFSNIAFIRAGMEMGLDVSNKTLSRFEVFMARFVGERLKRTGNE
ncbi:hypothetical protein [Photobacterium galatheae]|uniref:SMODS and SLOG-associating 2TM effector domain-containing protein n=1 Tax=Photobacterium galatheae TaxID=1654360 RepID=A0A066RHE8_9GAMM|nr:hypothetical protein [Photobacterium galatheae]KDM89714.1 hypothetical protein EA58_21140 [Photobacterium galatheae]MCM0151534.1 hypothetical protein [Photobacterium galatheae]